jgi:hypothetical protein
MVFSHASNDYFGYHKWKANSVSPCSNPSFCVVVPQNLRIRNDIRRLTPPGRTIIILRFYSDTM